MELKFDISKEYAVALEGGGAKGAYQIGVWKALAEAGVRFRAVAGASVGALNGALMVMNDLEKAIHLWENIRFSQIMDVDDEKMRRLYHGDLRGLELKEIAKNAMSLIREGGFDIEPLRKLLSEIIDEDSVRQSPLDFYLVTCSLTDKKELDLDAKTLPNGKLRDMLLASAYFPAFKQQEMDGKLYVDGCLANLVPVSSLVERGYTEIIVIRIYGVGVEKKVKIPKGVTITTIAPEAKLGGLLQFDSDQSRRDMTLGYFDGLRLLYGLAGKEYYIDAQWDEKMAYCVLQNILEQYEERKKGKPSLRRMHQEVLPRLARRVKAKGDYREVLLLLLERMAEEMEISPFRVYTEETLLRKILKEKRKQKPSRGLVNLLP